jgi:NAD(P)-dependent dehydrogenase (short-subunit alcohol dehydrogenase family)
MANGDTDPITLEGQVALITGGGSGIGLGCAKTFVARGAKVVISGRREEVLKKAVEELGSQADYRVHDVTDFAAAEGLIESVEKQHGALTALINNAGHAVKKPTVELTEEEMLGVFDVHVRGAFSLSKHAATRMMESGGGSILFMASMASLIGIPYIAAYAAAKSAHLGLVRTMAVEWSPKGVRVNAIAPGWILTDMTRETVLKDPGRSERILARTPMAQFGEPEDIGWAAAFLASPAARFITGVCLPVDGGVSIGF